MQANVLLQDVDGSQIVIGLIELLCLIEHVSLIVSSHADFSLVQAGLNGGIVVLREGRAGLAVKISGRVLF